MLEFILRKAGYNGISAVALAKDCQTVWLSAIFLDFDWKSQRKILILISNFRDWEILRLEG